MVILKKNVIWIELLNQIIYKESRKSFESSFEVHFQVFHLHIRYC